MEIVEQKYKNFIDFLKENIKDNSKISLLGNVSVEVFLKTLHAYHNETPQQITQRVSKKFDIEISQYSPEIVNKFERYIEYFQKVVKTLI